ncbi:hypothetical protein ACI394_30145, partial [Klebsiella pneumoniae]|uniref:hypothetical protein n=1 Tax=Klebsiella pneumoniae TaxID=573 RepID=UPI003853C9D0
KESLILCAAGYEANFVEFATTHGSQITKFVDSGIGYKEGKFYLVELTNEGSEYLFLVFRGYENHDFHKSELAFIPRIV